MASHLDTVRYFELQDPGLTLPRTTDYYDLLVAVRNSMSELDLDDHRMTKWIKFRHPLFPEFEPWEDNTGGVLHLCSLLGRIPLALYENGAQQNPLNTDGFTMRFDTEKDYLALVGYLKDSQITFIWGAATRSLVDLVENYDPDNLEIVVIAGPVE